MAQIQITNQQGGLSVRNALNGMFAELYGGLPIPLKLAGMSVNTNQGIIANTMVNSIFITPVNGGPVTLRIGITPNGQEILVDTVINASTPVLANEYFAAAGTLYFTFTNGEGTLNIRIDLLNDFN